MSESAKKQALDNLLRDGIVSYLDALYALQRFQEQATGIAVSVLKARVLELSSATGWPGLSQDAVSPYCLPDGEGNWAWLGARICVEQLNGFCCLALCLEADENGASAAHVTFFCGASPAAIFTKIKSAYRDCEFYWENEDRSVRECGFRRKLENPLAMETEFQRLMDHVINVWIQIGGWSRI